MLADTRYSNADGTRSSYYKMTLESVTGSGYLKDAHDSNRCNMTFWDGHAAAVSSGELDKILLRSESHLSDTYWGTTGLFARQ